MRFFLSLATLVLAFGCSTGSHSPWGLGGAEPDASADDGPTGDGPAGASEEPEPAVLNQRLHPEHGFRGDVHSLLGRQKPLNIVASWSPIHPGRALNLGYFPRQFYEPFIGLRPATIQRCYDGADFSALLPENVEFAGQMWSVDPQRVVKFVRQFHTSGSTKLSAPGRRAGPNGAFAILRAVSPTHLDIAFRIHAEFPLEPGIFLTPSCFLGRMILNRHTQSVELFQMWIPHDKALNAILTVRLETEALIDIVNIEQMELAGGDPELVERIAWDESVDLSAAHEQLNNKRVFYQFLDIEWVPPEQALEIAQQRKMPIMAVVVWGCLDEQNC